MEENVALNPVAVRLLSAAAVMAGAQGFVQAVHQFWSARRYFSTIAHIMAESISRSRLINSCLPHDQHHFALPPSDSGDAMQGHENNAHRTVVRSKSIRISFLRVNNISLNLQALCRARA